MLFLLLLVVRVHARLLVLSATDESTKELEILVLRHQLRGQCCVESAGGMLKADLDPGQIAKANSWNAVANRRLAGSSTASS